MKEEGGKRAENTKYVKFALMKRMVFKIACVFFSSNNTGSVRLSQLYSIQMFIIYLEVYNFSVPSVLS